MTKQMKGTVRFWIEDGVEVATLDAADFRDAMRERDNALGALAKRDEIERLRKALTIVLQQAEYGRSNALTATGMAGIYLAQGTFAHIRDTVNSALGSDKASQALP